MISGIEKVVFSNYRCFDQLELSLSEKINLFIGDNSSGKSTIIRGLSAVLNSFFSGYSDENTRFFGLEKKDFSELQTSTGLANELPIEIAFRFLGKDAKLELHSKKGRTLQKPLDSIYQYGKERYHALFEEKKQAMDLPLLASFSTSDIHAVRKSPANQFLKYDHKPSFGYYECLQGDGFLNYWTKRLLVLKEASRGEFELNGVKKAIINALGPQGCNIIKDIDIRHNQGSVYYLFVDGREIETSALSDGYRRLVNIVIDLAFRCMILNQGIFGLDACLLSGGTVLIDEIDLHLHPSLQAVVLKGLCAAFPRIQWIVTTHAPMVMTQIATDSTNQVYQLKYNKNGQKHRYQSVPVATYGLDASSIIDVYQHTTPRSEEVDKELKDLFEQIDDEHYSLAEQTLEMLKEKFGDTLPELSKAETLLNLFTDNNGHNS